MGTRRRLTVEEYADGVRAGDRRILARAITLAESTREDDQCLTGELLQALMPDTGKSVRVGISGVPGVGKSTLLEELGMRLVDAGHRPAVLAIDPSSAISGGSVLGDKTRMDRLAASHAAYIRPSPGGDALGGVGRRTREALLLCEAAGFDVVFVETIGVGQSETAVAWMVDVFLLLTLAGAGDELQGIKRGILELADVIAVTKADGDNADRARSTAAELRGALHILRGARAPAVQTCSATDRSGIDDLWEIMLDQHGRARRDGSLDQRRSRQAVHWFDAAFEDLLRARVFADPRVVGERAALRDAVHQGTLTPTAAAVRLAATIGGESSES